MAKRRRKKERHEEHIDESWLVPYADILTLLLALFIVLFASSSVDAVKFQQLSNVFNQVFNSGSSFMEYPSDNPSELPTSPEKKQGAEDLDGQANLGDSEKEELTEIQERVNQFINEKKLDNKLETTLSDDGLHVMIRDNVLFESGAASVRKQDEKLAKEISDLLVMNPPRGIVISGHTDNVPIKTNQFDSNWDLSVMRSVNFMKLLLENKKLDPEWFSAKGYGEFKPVASNSTKEGRAKNRRVEILIMPREQSEE
ncbi:flagellar motor protein MotB [Bacillus massiliglaciei]|uniref:flagellar motor protein MotB n=1 Tax=Bacillus massiliglaciei TaxID=1816693 RepID=UPI000B33B5A6|nr:flagellar motor protein MotB [Bacillus massiliglaciei]